MRKFISEVVAIKFRGFEFLLTTFLELISASQLVLQKNGGSHTLHFFPGAEWFIVYLTSGKVVLIKFHKQYLL